MKTVQRKEVCNDLALVRAPCGRKLTRGLADNPDDPPTQVAALGSLLLPSKDAAHVGVSAIG